MQVDELYSLTNWIESAIVKAKIVERYQNLQQVLHNDLQANKEQQPFEEQTKRLLDALKGVPLSGLSLGQLQILSTIGIGNNVGPDAVPKIEGLLDKNALDLPKAGKRIKAGIQEIKAGIQWAAHTRQVLSKIVQGEEIDEVGEEVLLRVHFDGGAHISNLTEFKYWARAWWEIGSTIAITHDEAPESIRVIGASNGLRTISFSTPYICAEAMNRIVSGLLQTAGRVLELRKQAEEIHGLKLKNDVAEKSILEEAENERKANLMEVIQFEIQKAGPTTESAEGDKPRALEKAVKILANFLEQGGEVDFIVPEEREAPDGHADANREKRDKLRAAILETRQLTLLMRSKRSGQSAYTADSTNRLKELQNEGPPDTRKLWKNVEGEKEASPVAGKLWKDQQEENDSPLDRQDPRKDNEGENKAPADTGKLWTDGQEENKAPLDTQKPQEDREGENKAPDGKQKLRQDDEGENKGPIGTRKLRGHF